MVMMKRLYLIFKEASMRRYLYAFFKIVFDSHGSTDRLEPPRHSHGRSSTEQRLDSRYSPGFSAIMEDSAGADSTSFLSMDPLSGVD